MDQREAVKSDSRTLAAEGSRRHDRVRHRFTWEFGQGSPLDPPVCELDEAAMRLTLLNPARKTGTFDGVQVLDATVDMNPAGGSFTYSGLVLSLGTVKPAGPAPSTIVQLVRPARGTCQARDDERGPALHAIVVGQTSPLTNSTDVPTTARGPFATAPTHAKPGWPRTQNWVVTPDDFDARSFYVQGVPIPLGKEASLWRQRCVSRLTVSLLARPTGRAISAQPKGKNKEKVMRRTAAAVTIMTMALAMTPLAALAGVDPIEAPQRDDVRSGTLALVRQATAAYHSLPNALDAGFMPFAIDGGSTPTCFDSDGGGMGVHYVRNVDDTTDATDPEALVYEISESGELTLVGVEYVVPQEFVEDESGAVVALPSLHGRSFHKHSTLPLYILHAWIWEENPEGTFADFNSEVGPCPANLATLTIH